LGNALYAPEALAELGAGDNATPAEFAALTRAAPIAAANAVHQSLRRIAAARQRAEGFDRPAEVRLLLVVDQLEEIFQFAREDFEGFAAALAGLVRSGGVWVVATMRSDFYAEFQSVAELVALNGEGLSFDLAPPSPAEIEEIVRAPAKAAGLGYERRAQTGLGLDDELIAAARQPGSLPLLQFTLDELFNDRDRAESALTIAAYDRLGGLEGAIERRAEGAFGALDAAARGELPALLREMVTWAGLETASGRVGRRERLVKPEGRARLLEAFVAARLLIADQQRVSLAHEAFITRWPRAAALIEADREFLRARARVEAAETQWRQEGRRPEFLLPRGRPLAEAAEILAQRREALDGEAIAFIEASQDAENARLEEERRREAERLRAEEAAKRKRLERFAVVVTALLLVAVGAAVYALDQRRLAIDRAEQAEHNFALALDATSDLVAKVQAGGMTVAISRNLLTAAKGVIDRLESIKDAPAVDEARIRLLDAFALLHLREGLTSQALGQAREAETIARALAAQSAPDPKAAPLLAASEEKVGETQIASGAFAQAAVEWEQARAFADPAAAADPGDGARQDLRASVHRGLGEALAARGDIGGALEEFQTAVSALDRPTITASDNASWKQGLAIARMRLAEALLTQGDLAKGAETYREAADAMQAVSDQFPAHGGYSASLALARRGQGDALARAGDWPGAIKAYQTALAIERIVAAKDPSSAAHGGNYAVTRAILGDALRETKDLTAAFDHLQAAIALLAPLVAADPANAIRKAQLALAYRLRGRTRLETGDVAGAARDFQDATTIWRDLGALDPDNAAWRFGMALTEVGAATAASRGGDAAAARAQFETPIATMQGLTALDPANADWRRALEIAHLRLGEALAGAPDPVGARREFEAALAIARGLADSRPENGVWRNEADAIGARLAANDGAGSAPK
jgi:tetratricopeptide (TPR) repeat protein